jgi:hypothetical protein
MRVQTYTGRESMGIPLTSISFSSFEFQTATIGTLSAVKIERVVSEVHSGPVGNSAEALSRPAPCRSHCGGGAWSVYWDQGLRVAGFKPDRSNPDGHRPHRPADASDHVARRSPWGYFRRESRLRPRRRWRGRCLAGEPSRGPLCRRSAGRRCGPPGLFEAGALGAGGR